MAVAAMTHLPTDVAALVELAASHAEGAQPLFEGHLESVASLYQVHPEHVERARAACTTAHGRSLASLLVDRAVSGERRAVASPRPAGRDVASLMSEAMSSTSARDLILRAPVELAAIQLGAHPFVVDEARLQLSR